jgi:hypothetical protein
MSSGDMNQMRDKFLSALRDRKTTSAKTTLPVGVVETSELDRVLRAMETLPSATNRE